MMGRNILKQALMWAALGAALSFFLAHPPLNHHAAIDRAVDRVIGIFVWAVMGGILGAGFAAFRTRARFTTDEATAHSPRQRPSDGALAMLQSRVSGQGKTGIHVSLDDGRTIVALTAGSSAQSAGLLVGDTIVAIDNQVCGTDYKSNVLRLVGEPKTTVRVSVWRGEAAESYDVIRL
jgi:predicted metalloprotease with PDZ domain